MVAGVLTIPLSPASGGTGKATGRVSCARWTAYSTLTTMPDELVRPIHPTRMPVILKPEDYNDWLRAEPADTLKLARPFEAGAMTVAIAGWRGGPVMCEPGPVTIGDLRRSGKALEIGRMNGNRNGYFDPHHRPCLTRCRCLRPQPDSGAAGAVSGTLPPPYERIDGLGFPNAGRSCRRVPVRRLEINFSQGVAWKVLISRYIGVIPLIGDEPCIAVQSRSGGVTMYRTV